MSGTRTRAAPTWAPAPRLASRVSGARFATARRALSGRERWYSRPSRAPILEEPYPACTHAHTLLVDLGCPMCARRSPYVACLVDTAQAVVCALSSPQASPSLGPDPRCVDSPACTPVCAHFYVRRKSVRLPVLLQTRPSPPGVTGPLVWLDLRMLRWPLAHPAALASQLPPSGTPNSIAHQHGIPAGSGKSVHPPIGCV